jgi:hypothetical protein
MKKFIFVAMSKRVKRVLNEIIPPQNVVAIKDTLPQIDAVGDLDCCRVLQSGSGSRRVGVIRSIESSRRQDPTAWLVG